MTIPNGNTPPSFDQRIFSDLHEQPGVSGVCLQLANHVLTHNLPYSDDRVADLAAHIERLCLSYENVGRGIWQILAGFETSWLLILSHQSLRLGVLLQPDTDPSLIASRGTRLLMEIEVPGISHPAGPMPLSGTPEASQPEARTWIRREFEQKLGGLLVRVAGHGTAQKIIQRELERQGAGSKDVLTLPEVERLGIAILDSIPNRGKRAALSEEFLSMINK